MSDRKTKKTKKFVFLYYQTGRKHEKQMFKVSSYQSPIYLMNPIYSCDFIWFAF